MKKILLGAALALLAASAAADNPYSPEGCEGTVVPINGVLTSLPATSEEDFAGCEEALGATGQVPQLDESGDMTCLRINVSGTVKASGHSVLTSVPVYSESLYFPAAATPFCFYNEVVAGFFGYPVDLERGCAPAVGLPPDPTDSAGLIGFTSSALLTGSVLGKKYQGTVYTKDQGYITADGFIGQVLLIVGGTGDFDGATGRAAIAGQEVGGFASYTGHVCINPPAE